MEKLLSTCVAPIPLKNSNEKGTRIKYPNKIPVTKDEKAKNTTGKADFFAIGIKEPCFSDPFTKLKYDVF